MSRKNNDHQAILDIRTSDDMDTPIDRGDIIGEYIYIILLL